MSPIEKTYVKKVIGKNKSMRQGLFWGRAIGFFEEDSLER